MSRSLATCCTLAALALVPLAYGAATRDELIRPGIGIAKARLGMTSTQLRKAMGKPMAVIVTPQGFGRRHLEWQYGYGSYIVRMQGPNGRERVMSVTTVLRREKTAAGIGVGVREAELLRREKGVRCEPHERDTDFAPPHVYMGGRRVCTIAAAQAQTVFVIEGPRVLLDRESVAEFEARWRREATVLLVSVRAADYREPSTRALAARQRDELIRPGVSIGKVRLGMTAGQLRTSLGKPWTVVADQRGFGRRQLDLQYASLNVTLFGQKGRERVVIIESKQERERTAGGVGIGVREAVLRAQPGVACEPHRGTDATIRSDFYNRIGGNRTCWIDGPSGARTLFVSTGPRVRLEGPGDTETRAEFERQWEREAKIALVVVRAAGYRSSPETSPN